MPDARTPPEIDLSYPLPPPGDERVVSGLIYSLRKAGSTMLAWASERLAGKARVGFANIAGYYFRLGVHPDDIPASVADVFRPRGYCYGVFRDPRNSFEIPILETAPIILQIRDPRDILVSDYYSIAYSHAPPGTSAGTSYLERFLADRERARSMGIDEFALEKAPHVLDVYRRYDPLIERPNTRIHRYEDLVFRKRWWLRDLADHLGWRVSDQAVHEVADHHDVIPKTERIDKMIRKVAPGDHVDKLRPETIVRLNDLFADVLEAHAYEADASPTSADAA